MEGKGLVGLCRTSARALAALHLGEGSSLLNRQTRFYAVFFRFCTSSLDHKIETILNPTDIGLDAKELEYAIRSFLMG